MVASVLVELPTKNIDRLFDYQIPPQLEEKIKIGVRVEVPFSSRKLEGFVLAIKDSSSVELKEIIAVIEEEITLNEELLSLGKYIKKETLSPLISCYQVMLPKALKAKKGTQIHKKYETYYRLNEKIEFIPNSTQKKILDCFLNQEVVSRKKLMEISPSSLKTLLTKQALIPLQKESYRLSYEKKEDIKPPLTEDQQKVVRTVEKEGAKTYLLWGVTGSGKTEVYMELIEQALKKGKTSIVLVPEISLTPQMIERFSKRFGNQIAALHSALSDGERYDEWRRIYRGEAKIVIGARSAVFAPFQNIGMIIVDEEHSDSYKQEDSTPHYSAIDIAKKRAEYHHCPVILGSATPSLDSFARALKKRYHLLVLPNRVHKQALPEVTIVDMNQEMKKSHSYFSRVLLEKINETFNRGEQVILLLNRRGYASFVTCKNCGYTMKCPHCDITLTYHKTSSVLRCHYCGYATKVQDSCPHCHEKSLSNLGMGTQKIEEDLKKIFPERKILRMDIDTTSKKGMHRKMIESFKNHEYDLLLGTQIVAKGLDFENVTLVGVINADTSLNIPDFRSSENTFDLLLQVAGRSGRSHKKGEVIIQTFNPNHYAIADVKNHDYYKFYQQEMQIRKQLKYPPYYYLVYIKLSSKDYTLLEKEALKIKKSLEKYLHHTIILGPSPAYVFKVKDTYRYGIILKYQQEEALYDTLQRLEEHYKSQKLIKVDINLNPIHF